MGLAMGQNDNMKLKIKRLSDDAIFPYKAYDNDLGYDLFSNKALVISPGQWVLISTGIAVKFPYGYGAIIKDRSSVAYKKGLFVHAGVIDGDYIGEIKILMYNGGPLLQHITKGEKIAQMVLTPVVQCDTLEVDILEETDRSDGGFGSTGE